MVWIYLFQANSTARDLQKRVEHMEKVNIELKSRLEETVTLYEQSQRDLRNKQQELMRCNAELEKTRDLKEQLARENKKLGGILIYSIIKVFESDLNFRCSILNISLHVARTFIEKKSTSLPRKQKSILRSKTS